MIRVDLRPWGKGHRYVAVHPDGTEQVLPRVSSILATLNKEALIPWAVGQTLAACRERVLPDRAYTAGELEAIWDWAKDAQYRTAQEAAQHGTRAHALIEAYLHSGGQDAPDLAAEHPAVANCWALWEEWWQGQDMLVTDLEAYVADTVLGYGGTVDCLARNRRHGNALELLDWKTSKGIYPEYRLQVVAYGGALARMGLGMPERATILRIGKEDAEFEAVTIWQSLDEARALYQAWKALVQVYAWRQRVAAEDKARWRKRRAEVGV